MEHDNYIVCQDINDMWYVHGAGLQSSGFVINTINSHSMKMNTEEEAIRASILCEKAYNAGYEQAQLDIRKTLGINY